MPAIPKTPNGHGLVIWPYALAVKPIPAGFSRDDDFADRFIQGHATTGGTPGGADHDHTFGHVHPGAAHTHAHTLGNLATAARYSSFTFDFGGVRVPSTPTSHKHAQHTSASATTSPGSTPTPTTVTASTTDPPHVVAVLLKPNDAHQQVPTNGVAFAAGDAPPGWQAADGTGEAPDLSDRFVKGAAVAGDGGALAGSATHDHGGSISHTHAMQTHTHAKIACGNSLRSTGFPVSAVRLQAQAGNTVKGAKSGHHNDGLATGGSSGTSDAASATISAESNEPEYTDLLAVENGGDPGLGAAGLIIPYTGLVADLVGWPDWLLCDGSGGTPDLTARQIRATTAPASVLDVGGQNSHSHTVGGHSHTAAAHSHSIEPGDFPYLSHDVGVAGSTAAYIHGTKHTGTHGGTVGSSSAGTGSSSSTPTGSGDVRQPWRSVLWIMFQPQTIAAVLPGGVLAGGVLK